MSAGRRGSKLRWLPGLFLWLVGLLTLSPGALTSAVGGDWPHWRGPQRNDIVAESSGYTGGAWPAGGELWQANVGVGCTSPVVVAGRLYVLGWQQGKDTLVCLEAATGRALWRRSYEAPDYGRQATGDQGIYSGPSSTPEFDVETGLLFTLSADGDLRAWDTAAEGASLWQLNLYDAYDVPQRPRVGRSGRRDYGYTSAPLVHGQVVIVEVGDDEGCVMAFDKRTGRRQWTSENKEPAGHTGGLAPMMVEGVPCAAVLNHFHLLVLRLDGEQAGRTVAEFPWETSFANNIAGPAVEGSSVVFTSAYNHHQMVRLDVSLSGAKTAWRVDSTSKVCSPLLSQGRVLWCWQNVECLNLATGKPLWQGAGGYGDPGSCILAGDDRLIVWSKNGRLSLVQPPTQKEPVGRVLVERDLGFRSDAWPHVVLADGRLFCKDRRGNLKCLALAAR